MQQWADIWASAARQVSLSDRQTLSSVFNKRSSLNMCRQWHGSNRLKFFLFPAAEFFVLFSWLYLLDLSLSWGLNDDGRDSSDLSTITIPPVRHHLFYIHLLLQWRMHGWGTVKGRVKCHSYSWMCWMLQYRIKQQCRGSSEEKALYAIWSQHRHHEGVQFSVHKWPGRQAGQV